MTREHDPRPNLARIAADAVHDAWLDASAACWERRARQLEDARPRRGDFVPDHVSLAELAERHRRLTQAAQACRHRATLAVDDLRDTVADLATGHCWRLELLDQQLAEALRRGDSAAVDRIEQVMDRLAPPSWVRAA